MCDCLEIGDGRWCLPTGKRLTPIALSKLKLKH